MGLPKGYKFSEEHKENIGAAHRGRPKTIRYTRVCVCGKEFKTGGFNKRFCSLKCRRASYGHGRLHSPEFSEFNRECAICFSKENLVGDHNHITGKARGILCRHCNLAIGNMKDNPERLRFAADYLERTN